MVKQFMCQIKVYLRGSEKMIFKISSAHSGAEKILFTLVFGAM